MSVDSHSSSPSADPLKNKKRPSLLEFLQNQAGDTFYPEDILSELSLQDGESFATSPLFIPESPQGKRGCERSASFGGSSKKLQSAISDCTDCEYIEIKLNTQPSRKLYNSFIGRSASM